MSKDIHKKELMNILKRASAEYKKWPKWMRSSDVLEEYKKLNNKEKNNNAAIK